MKVGGVQDLVQVMRSRDGVQMRDEATNALSKLLTWRMLPRLVLLAVGVVCKLCAQGVIALCTRRRRRNVVQFVPGARKGLTIKGVHLSGAAVKRARLMSQVALQRLWRQSRVVTLLSMWLFLQIVVRALTHRPSSRQDAMQS